MEPNKQPDNGPFRRRQTFPRLIVARMTPFGDTGPWKDFKASDLIHLALGGEMMNCGYDPDPSGRYDLPPIARHWPASRGRKRNPSDQISPARLTA